MVLVVSRVVEVELHKMEKDVTYLALMGHGSHWLVPLRENTSMAVIDRVSLELVLSMTVGSAGCGYVPQTSTPCFVSWFPHTGLGVAETFDCPQRPKLS